MFDFGIQSSGDTLAKSILDAASILGVKIKDTSLPFLKQFQKTGKKVEEAAKNIDTAIPAMTEAAEKIGDTADMFRSGMSSIFGGIIGGLVGWTMSAMTGMTALTPIGMFIGGVYNDYNKFCNGQLPEQYGLTPEAMNEEYQNLNSIKNDDLRGKYLAFRWMRLKGEETHEKKKAEEAARAKKAQEEVAKAARLAAEEAARNQEEEKKAENDQSFFDAVQEIEEPERSQQN